MAAPLLETRNISKRFGLVEALTNVSLSILPGRVHGADLGLVQRLHRVSSSFHHNPKLKHDSSFTNSLIRR
jgi:ABC-type phosphonate transport system ATPase subunit